MQWIRIQAIVNSFMNHNRYLEKTTEEFLTFSNNE